MNRYDILEVAHPPPSATLHGTSRVTGSSISTHDRRDVWFAVMKNAIPILYDVRH